MRAHTVMRGDREYRLLSHHVSGPFAAALLAVGLLTLTPVWIPHFPPGTDLPQHAAQIALADRMSDSRWPFRDSFQWNPLAPHLVGFLLARTLALAFSEVVAFKVLLSISLLSLPVATARLLRGHHYDRWWLLLTLPIGISYSFRFGFVQFALAAPLVLWFVALMREHLRQPRLARGAGVATLAVLLFFSHVIAFAMACVIGAVLAVGTGQPRRTVLGLLPMTPAALIAVTWALLISSDSAAMGVADRAHLGWHRLAELPAWTVGKPVAFASVWMGLIFLALPFATTGYVARSRERWLPLCCTLLLFFLVPLDFFGTSFLYPRLALFVLPFLLLGLNARPASHPTLARGLILATSLAWTAAVAVDFLHYRREMTDLREVVGRIAPERRVLYVAAQNDDPQLPGAVYLHAGLWYQVERRGIVDFSFAEFFPNPYIYSPGHAPPLPLNFEWHPSTFNWLEHGGQLFDCFLVHASRDLGPSLLRDAPAPPRLELRIGSWWVYSIEHPIAGQRDCLASPTARSRSFGARGKPDPTYANAPAGQGSRRLPALAGGPEPL